MSLPRSLRTAASLARITGALMPGMLLFFTLFAKIMSPHTTSIFRTLFEPINFFALTVSGVLVHASFGIERREKRAAARALIVALLLLVTSVWKFQPQSGIGIALSSGLILSLLIGWPQLTSTNNT